MAGAWVAAVLLLALSSASTLQHRASPKRVSLQPATPRADDVNYLLPAMFSVFSYDLRLVPYIVEGNFTFDGDVVIAVQPLFDVINITLHADKLTIDSAAISVRDAFTSEEVGIVGWETDALRHFYVIHLSDVLRAGVNYTITFNRFTGILDDDMLGFYRSSYVENGIRRWLATTQFESTNARRAFPCFDEPIYKATLKLSISRTENLRAIANMPQVGAPELDTEHTSEVRYWDHFQTSPVMSTYLIAFVVSDFVYLENAAKGFRIFAQAPLISQARYSLSVSPTILDQLAVYTGIPFQLPKMDEVAVPDFDLGAMENWGLVTYRERYILFGDGVSHTLSQQRIATIVAHEFSHQWFGDLVTPVLWDYLWLNEGFATYFEYFLMAEIEPTWRLEEQFVPDVVQYAMSSDASQSSHPMSQVVGSPESINSLFDSITYEKAGSVLRMLSHILSPDTYRRGLNKYLLSKSYSNAQPDDLFAILNIQLHQENPDADDVDIKTVMDTWTLQMGYPVVMVTRDYAANTALLQQERFLYAVEPDHPDTHDYTWHIPLTYTTQGSPDFDTTATKDWLVGANTTIASLPGSDEWLMINVQETGYYRVNYDPANWALLQAHLDSALYESIHTLNRAQLIDDSFNLARAGQLAYSTPLGLSLYLAREVDYIPWASSLKAFTFIDDKVNTAAEYNVFQDYMLKLVNLLYTTVGFDVGDNDGHVLKLNRAAAVEWVCHLNEPSCIAQSQTLMAEWIANPNTNPIKPDQKKGVYCTSIHNGGSAEWDFLWEQYLIVNVATETSIVISSLGCSTNETTLRLYMETAVTEGSPIRKQDASAVFSSVYNNQQGVDVALDYLIEDYQKIAGYFGGFGAIDDLFINIANKCTTQEQADKLTQFLADNSAELGSTAQTVERAIEIVEENIEWQKTYGQEIIDWIKVNGLRTYV